MLFREFVRERDPSVGWAVPNASELGAGGHKQASESHFPSYFLSHVEAQLQIMRPLRTDK